MDRIEQGVLYSAFGEKFVGMALESAKSVKECMPDTKIALFSDVGSEGCPFVDFDFEKFGLDGLKMRKVDNLLRSPFEKTLLLDSDTYVIDDLDSVFQLLDRFDLLVAHAPNRNPLPIEGIPESFPELNCGMIGIKRSEASIRFLKEWDLNFRVSDSHREQPSFRKTLYESNISFFILPPEYNFRTNFPGAVGEGETVKILHGKGNDMASLAKKINRTRKARVSVTSFRSVFSGEVISIRPILGLIKEAILNVFDFINKRPSKTGTN